ncbi:MAG: molybdopterin-guanine dinucleotide biosynthesis protein B [Methanobrevibacter sp.]|uniref:molybdopterin-guanine dinucleotide biosynthesis protein B n=1 Tax=Methanobrevibacter sp. TaxID=66852 RepID=UPI0025CCE91A|nr:molybdopterin-guanine dinucleotide biosynthesis protein B [Methanobrevibacter sp.]MBR0272324.1 molybdopterin-guanine dinucleotide biosynthesis protein B [Methanobrevibacter sp.]
MKIVSIVGRKNTGKTSLSVKVIRELTKRGYNVASVKHSHHSIEMDKENTDTWKHKQAGANLVVGVGSTTFFNSREEHDLNRILYLLKHFDDFDFVIIEGYKTYNYPKIATSPEVVDEYTIKEVNSFEITPEGVSELADLIEQRGHDIIDTLFANNCGFNNGEVIAKEIREGKLTVEELDKVHSYLSIDNKVVGMNRFVSDYLKKSVLGIISTLNLEDYGVEDIDKIEVIINKNIEIPNCEYQKCDIIINNDEIEISNREKEIISNSVKAMINSIKTKGEIKKITVEVTDIENNELVNSPIHLKTNDNAVEINEFTQGIIKETIYAIIKSVYDDEIKEFKIDVEV